MARRTPDELRIIGSTQTNVVMAAELIRVAQEYDAAAPESLQIGDLDSGAPELHEDSRYNRDNAYIAGHYAASSDILTVMVATPEDQCTRYAVLSQVDALAWHQDEPFGSTSIYAQWEVFRRAAAGKVRVILDGQGADELLGGYPVFFGARLAGRGTAPTGPRR